ncbi:hypothetical protein BGZ65_000225, partial [Modicella reniformis]
MSGQAIIKRSIDQHFDRLEIEMDKNKQLQEQIVQMQKTMDEKQDQTLRMQQTSLDRVIWWTNQFKLLDCTSDPYPDLRTPRVPNPSAVHCPHLRTARPHEIHMAKHEGYDLEQPTEFFGSYVLKLMIKFEIAVAGVIVPPLANFKIANGLETAQKHLEYLKNIAPLVDDTIRFLQDIKSNNETGSELATEQSEFISRSHSK